MDLDSECALLARSCLCFNLRKATRLLTQIYDAALKPSGLRVTQLSVLVAVELGEPIPMQRLAEMLGMERTTLTRNLKSLEEADFVSSAPGDDRRSRLVSLTEAGRDALATALPLWHGAQASAVKALGGEQVPVLMPILTRISQFARTAIAVEGADEVGPERRRL